MAASSEPSHNEGDANYGSSQTKGNESSHNKGDANNGSSQSKGHESSHNEGNANSGSSQSKGHESSHNEGDANSGSSQAKGNESSHNKGDANSGSSQANESSHNKGDANSGSSQTKGNESSHNKGDANSRSSQTKGGKSDKEEEYTALEKHVAFFDRNGDGIIYPWETYQGFRALGIGILGSALSGLLINMAISKKTRPGKSFSPLFPIEVKNIHKCIHGSDTNVYDRKGRFDESRFEGIFRKHAHKYRNALSYKEIGQMLKTNRERKDLEGWISAWAEWKLLHQLYKDKNGMVTEEQIRGVYDGSLFKQVEKERLSSFRDKKIK